ncbi:MAG: hypothetical protein MK108_15495 [Mariniblastus sp.]|nr:hypothetical protein [Mariniblastus sp.]
MENETKELAKSRKLKKGRELGIGAGLALGVALGAALGNVGLGILIGLVLGVALGPTLLARENAENQSGANKQKDV